MSLDTYKALEQLMSKIQTPTEKVRLPAEKGVYPPEVIEFDEDGLVEVSPLITEDERLFASASAFTDGSGVFEMLKKRVEGCHKPELLYEPEVEFLVAAIRALTFTSEYEVKYTCTGCGKENDVIINSNDLMVKSYAAGDTTDGITLKNGQRVEFKQLPSKEQMKLAQAKDPSDQYLARITEVDGITDAFAIGKWFRALPLAIKKELVRPFKIPLGGFETDDIPTTCPHCQAENKVSVSLVAGFFIRMLVDDLPA